jgi:DNA repair photolyase
VALRTIDNPPNPWASSHVDWLGDPPDVPLQILEEQAGSILSENRSPDLGFRYSLNPYRGCQHACAYCYARPTHQYWDFGAGADFERKIVAKVNAAEKLRETFERRSWTGELIVLSGNTDCYQPIEASMRLTRACLEVCADYRNPVGIITKSALIRRDLDLLSRLARDARVGVNISVPFADAAMARAFEPGAPAPKMRFETIRLLAEAGVRVGVAVAPVIPGLNDHQVIEILERAAEAGATSAFRTLVRLAPEVLPVFEQRLEAAYPLRHQRVMNAIRETRDGAVHDARFGRRMRGTGPRFAAIEQVFDLTCRRVGITAHAEVDELDGLTNRPTTFRRPSDQLSLL